jgi:hypothetical protein
MLEIDNICVYMIYIYNINYNKTILREDVISIIYIINMIIYIT